MNKIATFFRTLVKSSTDPAYYNDVVAAPSSFSWKYYILFNLLTALITVIIIGIPLSLFDVAGKIRQVSGMYPQDLVITGDERGVTVNQPLPYMVPMPEQWRQDASDMGEETTPSNLITFASDEQVQGLDDYYSLDSIAVITESTVYAPDDDNGIKVYPMPEFEEPFTISSDQINDVVNRIVNHPLIAQKLYIPLVGLVLLLLAFPITLMWRIVTLFVFAGIAFVLTKAFMAQKQLPFGKVFQISLHTITPIIVIGYVAGVFGFWFWSGLVYLAAYLGWTLFVISRLNWGLKTAPVVTATTSKKVIAPKKARKVKKKV